MIPKIIHYCWFGSKDNQTDVIKKCLNSWKEKLPDWEFVEWNESNSDLSQSKFAQKMLENKRYAFVSDYVRLQALYKYGGVYFDTDVLVFKDFSPMLEHDMFLGFMLDNVISTAIIGCKKGNKDIYNIMKLYETDYFKEPVINNDVFTDYFVNQYPNLLFNNKKQELSKNVYIYPKEVFEFPSLNKSISYSRHMYEGSWKKNNKKNPLKKIIRKVLTDKIYFKLNHDFVLVKKQKYYKKYLEDKNK